MTQLFLQFNTGNSGGSWMESVINSHPSCHAIEEPRRKLSLSETGQELQERLLYHMKSVEGAGMYESFGYIKGFRADVLQYVLDHGGRVVQQVRHPLKQVWGTRRRVAKPRAYLGREPEDEREYWIGLCGQQGTRYGKFLRRQQYFPIWKLEDLSELLLYSQRVGEGLRPAFWGPFAQKMEWLTQVGWSDSHVRHVAENVFPHHRKGKVKAEDMWNTESIFDPPIPFAKNPDPTVEEIWGHLEDWQQDIFLEFFSDTMATLSYEVTA